MGYLGVGLGLGLGLGSGLGVRVRVRVRVRARARARGRVAPHSALRAPHSELGLLPSLFDGLHDELDA